MNENEPMRPALGNPAGIPVLRRHRDVAPATGQPIRPDVLDDAPGRAEQIDLRSYWNTLLKRRWTVLGCLAIVLATTLVGTLMLTPIYRATAVLQIERDAIKVVDVSGIAPVEAAADRDFYQTQYELLRSRTLLQRAIDHLDLGSGPMPGHDARSPWEKLLAVAGVAPARSTGEPGPEPEHAQREDANRRAMLDRFAQGLAVEPVRNSRLARVHYDSPDREFSQRAANAVAEAFIASNIDRRLDSSSYAKQYLEERLQELKQKLEESERQLVGFAQKEQIIDTGPEIGSLTQKTIVGLGESLARAREERVRAEARWKQAQGSRGMVLYGEMGQSSIIQTLQEGRAKLLTEYQEQLRLFKPGYPSMQQLEGRIKEAEQQIAREVATIKSAIHAEYLAALQQEQMLAEQISGARSAELDLQSRSIQYNIFKREVDTNRQLYDGLLQRYKEIGIAGGVSANNISIIDRAEPGAKHSPRLGLNLAGGSLLGLFLGVLFALGFEYVDDTLKAPEDVEQQLQLALLGVVPRLKAPQTPVGALKDPRSAFAESYRSLRTALQFSTDQGVPRCLLVTSASAGEGKSTTALALALHFAQLGKRVLLIDCDLRNPSLHQQIGIDNSTGLTHCLTGSAKPPEVVRKTRTANLSVIPAGPLPPNPAELLMGPRMLALLNVAVARYDLVLLDGPPVLGLADAPLLASLASGTLLVVEAGKTRVGVARNALRRLRLTRSRIVGAALT
ncbi:MAG TPA: polysaccharide biosynthesis tyrosine autokinase, partial [Dokdonella sp.]